MATTPLATNMKINMKIKKTDALNQKIKHTPSSVPLFDTGLKMALIPVMHLSHVFLRVRSAAAKNEEATMLKITSSITNKPPIIIGGFSYSGRGFEIGAPTFSRAGYRSGSMLRSKQLLPAL